MKRRPFTKQLLLGTSGLYMTDLSSLRWLNELPDTDRMPVLFVGHGNPMNAIEDNRYSKTWREKGQNLPRPKAILSISAHWITPGKTKVTVAQRPRTIHDFGGFPQTLFEQQYPAPGAVDQAKATIELVQKTHIQPDDSWGYDHGTWSVLLQMFPNADIPVYQLSLDYAKAPAYHLELAKELTKLRDKGVLIMGSGNLVHNLRMMQMHAKPYDWTIEFDQRMKAFIDDRDFDGVANFQQLGQLAKLAHPSHDHFLPILYSLGVVDSKDKIDYFCDDYDLASVSMRSLLITSA